MQGRGLWEPGLGSQNEQSHPTANDETLQHHAGLALLTWFQPETQSEPGVSGTRQT